MPAMRTLNLGSGRDVIDGAIRVDRRAHVRPDVVADLDHAPWPFADDSFDLVYAKDVIEHLADVVRTMEELHRVCRAGARIVITTPHFSSYGSYTDPTHRQHLGFFSLDYFTDGHPLDFYSRARFAKEDARLVFEPGWKNKLVWRLANAFPRFWERHLAWMLPAWFIGIELRVLK
jgi:SAM-dependent methyltransferase